MNRQEVFNRVATHLLTQMEQSRGQSWSPSEFYAGCQYRGKGGLSCAIGCLITDEAYYPELEGKGIGMPAVIEALIKSGIDMNDGYKTYNAEMLCSLQNTHDLHEPEYWYTHLRQIANNYNLTFPEGV